MSSSCPNSETTLFSSEELFKPRLAPEINGWPSLSERTPANARSRSSSSKPIQQHPLARDRVNVIWEGKNPLVRQREEMERASAQCVCVCSSKFSYHCTSVQKNGQVTLLLRTTRQQQRGGGEGGDQPSTWLVGCVVLQDGYFWAMVWASFPGYTGKKPVA